MPAKEGNIEKKKKLIELNCVWISPGQLRVALFHCVWEFVRIVLQIHSANKPKALTETHISLWNSGYSLKPGDYTDDNTDVMCPSKN